jgi:prepilin-type processing-associated H-X9-DG protein
MVASSGEASRRPSRLLELIALCAILGFLGAILLPAVLTSPQTPSLRVLCANNLNQIGMALRIWAATHSGRWPDVFTEESEAWNEVGGTCAADGSDNGRPVASNTANFWVLAPTGYLTPEVFQCPASAFWKPDSAADPSRLRDFCHEAACSYSLQNLLGPYALSDGQGNASALPVAADASPLRRDFWSGAPGAAGKGATDRELARRPMFVADAWKDRTVANPWELNSPNHAFQGQNVLYLDGHVAWTDHPYCGPGGDNIWVRRRTGLEVAADPGKVETLRNYDDGASYDGKCTLPPDALDDSFLVP